MTDYKLSTALYGHSLDVRALAVTPDGCIISASRDKTAKVWKPNEFNANYCETITLKGHTNFVGAVTFVPSSSRYPQGLVITGSNDKTICVFDPNTPDPLFSLKEHTNTVCSISPGIKENTFLSASWDLTAKLWCLETQQSILTIKSHESAVWSVIQLANGIIVTGSADKTIKLHSTTGQVLNTLTGHSDCVRGLAVLNDTQFVSCSNDASIKLWDSTTGKCLQTYYGHPNFIYSVAAQGDLLASSGEDQCVCVYQNDQQNSFQIPAQSVWAITILPNSDIVTGSSDGIVRVFSAVPERQGDDMALSQFAEEVKKLKSANTQEIGGVKVADLPGREVLYEPGKSDGQVKMIRDGDKVMAFSWSESKKKWETLGDVMGSAGGTQENSGKVLYEGKEYDFVFSVDVQEGMPPLKLPYNVSEDPWHAAQKFIHKNDLSQVFLEQVANFIITNSKSKQPVITQQAPPTTEVYADPFTGGTRYIPGAASNNTYTAPAPAGDPFTGDSSYKTNGFTTQTQQKAPELKFFPQEDFVRFDQANLKVILEKLKQFTETLRSKPDSQNLDKIPTDAELESMIKLGELNPKYDDDTLILLKQLMTEWPQDYVFPVLDITRLAIRNSNINLEMCSDRPGRRLLASLRNFLNQESSSINNQMLSLRILTNMFSHPPGESLVLSNKEYIFGVLIEFSQTKLNKPMQIALVSLLLNCVISYRKSNDQSNLTHALEILSKMLPNLIESEATLRALITLGTLIYDNTTLRKHIPSEVKDLILRLSESNNQDHSKVTQCSLKLLDIILT